MNLPDINRSILFKTADGVLAGFFLGTVFSGVLTPTQNVPYDTDEVTGWAYIDAAYDAFTLQNIRSASWTFEELNVPSGFIE